MPSSLFSPSNIRSFIAFEPPFFLIWYLSRSHVIIQPSMKLLLMVSRFKPILLTGVVSYWLCRFQFFNQIKNGFITKTDIFLFDPVSGSGRVGHESGSSKSFVSAFISMVQQKFNMFHPRQVQNKVAIQPSANILHTSIWLILV